MKKVQLEQKEKRNSAIELLRIFAAIIIVGSHFAVHGKFHFNAADPTINYFWFTFLRLGGKLGVDLFVLISGYFLVSSTKRVTIKKMLSFWGPIFFYSIIILLIAFLISDPNLTANTTLKSLFPISKGTWWFASTYFVLYLIHPYLNKVLTSLSKKEYKTLLAILLTLWCIIPSLTKLSMNGSDLAWFVTMYSVAGYIKLYGNNKKIKSWKYIIIAILLYLISWVFNSVEIFGISFSRLTYTQNSIMTTTIAILLFLGFLNLRIGYHKWINVLGSTTFAVYLISDNIFVRMWLWRNIFKNAAWQDSAFLIPYALGAISLTFIGCVIIDLIRQHTIHKLYMNIINRINFNQQKGLKK